MGAQKSQVDLRRAQHEHRRQPRKEAGPATAGSGVESAVRSVQRRRQPEFAASSAGRFQQRAKRAAGSRRRRRRGFDVGSSGQPRRERR